MGLEVVCVDDFELRFIGGPAGGQKGLAHRDVERDAPARYMEFIEPWPGTHLIACGGVKWVYLHRYERAPTRTTSHWKYRFIGTVTAVQDVACFSRRGAS